MDNDSTDSNPSVRQLTFQSVTQFLHRYLPTVQMTPEQVQHHVVRRVAPPVESEQLSSDDSYVSFTLELERDDDVGAGFTDARSAVNKSIMFSCASFGFVENYLSPKKLK